MSRLSVCLLNARALIFEMMDMISRRGKESFQRFLLEAEDREKFYVCLNCIKDDWLRSRADHLIKSRECFVCGALVDRAQRPEKVAEIIKKALHNFFTIDCSAFPNHTMTLSEIVGRAIRCKSKVACDKISELLVSADATEEDFYFFGQEYLLAPNKFDSEEHQRWWVEGDWQEVSSQLTHGQRFFNENAKKFFESLIFEAMWGAEKRREAPAAVRELPEGSKFFRARVSSNQEDSSKFKADPLKELGAPPPGRAANNRMSAAGVSLFYAAGDFETCIAEVRPSIGDEVVVGEFTSTKNLKFFDFSVLESLDHEPISWFSPSYDVRSSRRMLLRYLHDLIARPVRIHDTDYVMTQALAEYIRYCHYEFDGVAFKSVQRSGGGINFVLFDQGSAGDLLNPGRRPEFSMAITEQAVAVYKISGVQYTTSTVSDELKF
ncbi:MULTISPECIES: RES family NAD+ phosphorylase [unclassified Pseudomonas]|uniref:RES family NAD+ phosphorylase n=1 Tax=unclassified Pseudomonas TaxID=196821 RepID=UPI00381CFFED